MRKRIAGLGMALLCTACVGFSLGLPVYAEAAELEYSNGLLETDKHLSYISGYTDGTFGPGKNITRAEAASMFEKLLKNKPAAAASRFDDVDNQWYTNAINNLAQLGIISGKEENKFAPLEYITRAEFVSIAAKFVVPIQGTLTFPDVSAGHWAFNDICTVNAYGLVDGYEDETFRPDNHITRAEVVSIINKLLKRPGDPNSGNYESTKKFSDLNESHWAFSSICEAATNHDYFTENGKEKWDVSENFIYTWEETEEGWKFKNVTKDIYVTGFRPVNGLVHYFDPETELLVTGWQEIDGKNYILPEKDEKTDSAGARDYLSKTNFDSSERTWQDIDYITVHYTANPGDNAYESVQYFYEEYRASSAHYFVDESSVWRSVADKDMSWHSGGASQYFHETARNENSIGIEMCCRKTDTTTIDDPTDLDWYFLDGTETNSAALVKSLMKQYAVPIENVIRHTDITHKICPAPYVNVYAAWQNFLTLITKNEINYRGDYDINVTQNNVTVHSGPETTDPVVNTLQKGAEATVFEEKVMTKPNPEKPGGKDVIRWARIGPSEWILYDYIMRE